MLGIKKKFEENKRLIKVINSALDEIRTITDEVWDNVDTDTDAKLSDYERGLYVACRRINRRMQEALEMEEE